MLSQTKLPKSFWREAMKAIIGIINFSLSVPIGGAIL